MSSEDVSDFLQQSGWTKFEETFTTVTFKHSSIKGHIQLPKGYTEMPQSVWEEILKKAGLKKRDY